VDARPLYIANWKMNLTEPEVTTYLNKFKPLVFETQGRAVVIAPGFASLKTATILTERARVYIGAQDVSPEESGAYTGEVSAKMLASVGCRFALVGHSERRRRFGEAGDLISRKMRAAMATRLIPVLCVGETAEERGAGNALEVVERQLREGLAGVEVRDEAIADVAYEPVWAIGTGDHATPEQAEEMHRHIRSVLESLYPGSVGGGIRILYGGSVTPENVASLMAQPTVNGVLVGGASLDPEKFAAICNHPDPGASAPEAGAGPPEA